ncbi:hypothetical protein V496_09697 [Pseudogymnoascus sp. VKM F-4515 (FW-2607)]|nr:hypothetical protein V496_09697 [Pseudogymnoascus sp. VKM F-4515 (FW-2607)]
MGIVSSTGPDNDDEVDGQSLSTSADASTSTDPSQAAYVAEEVDEDNILAILDGDEVAFGDAIREDQDEDFIPGPDDEGSGEDDDGEADADPSLSSDDIATSSGGAEISVEGVTNPPAQKITDDRCVARFRRRMRMVITGLKEFANGIKYDPAEQWPTYPISYSFWFLLCRVSADDLIESYTAAIPRKVQVLLGQNDFTPASILTLDRDWKHHHLSKGVYVGLPLDKSTNDYKCYVGSACRSLSKRISEHMRIARSYTPSELPGKLVTSMHYKYICKTNVVGNFRILAAFPSRDVPDGYVHLLEAIMMIILQSCPRPLQNSRFMNSKSHELMRTLRIDAGIPGVQWAGLNAAWPAIQGFRMDRVPCTNKTRQGRLPTSTELHRLVSKGKKLAVIRLKAGPDPECGDCGRKESFLNVKHLVHNLAPGVLLCSACVMQLKTHGLMHTAEERAKLVGVSNLVAMRKIEDILCENCAVSESSQLTRQHIYNAEVGKVLCSACDGYRRMFGRDRDLSFETKRQAFQGTKKQREDGMSVNCQQCNAAETPETSHHYNAITGKVLCKACDLYHRKHGEDRDVSKEIRRQGMIEVKRKREEGVPMNCDQCNTAEPPGISHIYNAERKQVLCVACDNYRRKNGQDRDISKEVRRQALNDIKKRRADGIPLYCDECSKAETPAATGKRRFTCSGANNRLLCMTCTNKAYSAAMKAKKAAKDGVGSGA